MHAPIQDLYKEIQTERCTLRPRNDKIVCTLPKIEAKVWPQLREMTIIPFAPDGCDFTVMSGSHCFKQDSSEILLKYKTLSALT